MTDDISNIIKDLNNIIDNNYNQYSNNTSFQCMTPLLTINNDFVTNLKIENIINKECILKKKDYEQTESLSLKIYNLLYKKILQQTGYYSIINVLSTSISIILIINSICNNNDYILICKSGIHFSSNKNNIFLKSYKIIEYDCNDQGIDYNNIEILCKKYKPKIIMVGLSSYNQQYDFIKLKKIIYGTDTVLVFDGAHDGGLILSGAITLNNEPDIITCSPYKTLGGNRGGVILTKNKKLYDLLMGNMNYIGEQSIKNTIINGISILNSSNILDVHNKALLLSKKIYYFFKERNFIMSFNKEPHNHIVLISIPEEYRTQIFFESTKNNIDISLFTNEFLKYGGGIRLLTTCIAYNMINDIDLNIILNKLYIIITKYFQQQLYTT